MSAAIVALADAVISDLNSGTDWDFTATRAYLPKFNLKDSADLQVQVVPKTDARSAASRGYDGCDLTVDVGMMQRVSGTAAEELAALDDLMELAEQVKEFLSRRRPTDFAAAVCTAVKHEPIYDVEQLDGERVFLTVISATFYVERPCSTPA
jgi:hypothetical protein